MDVIVFFDGDFFHTVEPIEMLLKTYHYFNKMKRGLGLVHIGPQTLVLCSITFLVSSKYLENDLTKFDEILCPN